MTRSLILVRTSSLFQKMDAGATAARDGEGLRAGGHSGQAEGAVEGGGIAEGREEMSQNRSVESKSEDKASIFHLC